MPKLLTCSCQFPYSWLAVPNEEGFSLSTIPTRLRKNSPHRRSQRVLIAVNIFVSGLRPDGQPFSEEAVTTVVHGNGALLYLAEEVIPGQWLTIRNLLSNQELRCEILEVGRSQDGGSEVAIEFLQPAPRFWRISFPPHDWTPRSPEAKRIALAPVPFPQTSSENSRF